MFLRAMFGIAIFLTGTMYVFSNWGTPDKQIVGLIAMGVGTLLYWDYK